MRILSARIFSKSFGGKIRKLNSSYTNNEREPKKVPQNFIILNMR